MSDHNAIFSAARDLALAKINTGFEPPWAWYQYMKLVEACDHILTGCPPITDEMRRYACPTADVVRLVGPTDVPADVE